MKRLALLLVLVVARPAHAGEPVCRVRADRADYETLVIAPVVSRFAIVEEDKYQQLPSTLAANVTEQLRDLVKRSRLFDRVTLAEACPEDGGKAVRVETSITSLVHSRGIFHIGLHTRIVRCPNGDGIYSAEQTLHSRQEAIATMPERMAGAVLAVVTLQTTPCKEQSR
jgi:hypothetical protein